MSRNGGCNFNDLKKLQKSLQTTEAEMQTFIESCAKELAARLLAKVIKRTPVRKPENCPPGVVGGTLRRGWTGEKASSGANYAKTLQVKKTGSTYQIEIVNPIEYASYVEFGHRTRGGKGWKPGVFMLTISEQEIERAAPAILEKKIQKKLGECFK
ncbi:HK97 gp10 family phage protein [Chakrabartyella piscis]|uniref:HK97 gp10 family phage protein n=1 Tax=Chakrabartyella piscis TaxID=2918914 RepID=UPI0029587116|nr:HK97 gp10 family phage protein [Chakrabartyella piscis]